MSRRTNQGAPPALLPAPRLQRARRALAAVPRLQRAARRARRALVVGRRLANLRALTDLPAALARLHGLPGSAGRLDIGPYPVAYVGRPESVRAVLDTRAPGLAERGRFFEDIGRVVGPSSLVTCAGEQHRRLRRLIAPAFRPERVADYAATMVQATGESVARWRDGEVIDLSRAMGELTLEIAARALFGMPGAGSLAAFDTVLRAGTRVFYRVVLPRGLSERLWASRLSPVNRRLSAAQGAVDRLVAALLAERRRAAHGVEAGPPPNLLDVLLAARDEPGGPLSDDELRDQVVTFLFAGHETTAQALTWAFVELARHPEVEAALAGELDRVLGGRRPQFGDLPRLTYTRAVVRETLRLRPPAWFLSREADADSEIDGCPIPAGALVLTSPLIMHRDGRFWDDPERFDPTRWQRLDSLGESPVAYLPFGWGRRNCIGSSFAQAELALVLATVASSWRVQVQRPGRVRPRATVTLRPASAVRARLRQRSGPSPVL